MRTKKPVPPKGNRQTLKPSEWNFFNLSRSASYALCTREYAKECLQCLNYSEIAGTVDLVCSEMPQVDSAKVAKAVQDGLRLRKNISDAEPMTWPALLEADMAKKRISGPPGSEIVAFTINWRASNKEIKRAFGEWLAQKDRGIVSLSTCMHVLYATICAPATSLRQYLPYDYVDMHEAIGIILTPRGARLPQESLIKSQRLITGSTKGRGDTKRALLTDLGIYRLVTAGYEREAIASLFTELGHKALKFVEPAQMTRAHKSAEQHIRKTFYGAILCEVFAATLKERLSRLRLKNPTITLVKT